MSWKRRWGKRGAIAAGALLIGFYVLLPIGAAIFVGKHTGAIDEEPEEYERRVIGFFDRRLLGRS